jgi:hypothetical protein
MSTNKEILKDALNTGKPINFMRGGMLERNVKIVYLNGDDVCNKDFIFQTEKGERYNGFENNVTFV